MHTETGAWRTLLRKLLMLLHARRNMDIHTCKSFWVHPLATASSSDVFQSEVFGNVQNILLCFWTPYSNVDAVTQAWERNWQYKLLSVLNCLGDDVFSFSLVIRWKCAIRVCTLVDFAKSLKVAPAVQHFGHYCALFRAFHVIVYSVVFHVYH